MEVSGTYDELAALAAHCTACKLSRDATQVVFGDGPVPAPLMLMGEQPGDREDRDGEPFVGPAGRVLDDACGAAGIDRATVYVTNAVKHFRWEPARGGKVRLHKKPSAAHNTADGWIVATTSVPAMLRADDRDVVFEGLVADLARVVERIG